jgi:uncharacterized membrane protein YcaP (DUF421 family)
MVFDGWYDVFRVVAVGVMAYVLLVVVLRSSGKRTLAKLNAFDLVVTVSLGSALATIALSSDVALAEGLAAIAVLCAAQYAVASSASRWPAVRRAVRSDPTLVVADGRLLTEALRRERLTESEVRQAIRSSGGGAVEDVGAVVLESDGTLSVVRAGALGSGSALVDVRERHR